MFLRRQIHSEISFWCLKGVIFELDIDLQYKKNIVNGVQKQHWNLLNFIVSGKNALKHLSFVVF